MSVWKVHAAGQTTSMLTVAASDVYVPSVTANVKESSPHTTEYSFSETSRWSLLPPPPPLEPFCCSRLRSSSVLLSAIVPSAAAAGSAFPSDIVRVAWVGRERRRKVSSSKGSESLP